MLMERGNPHRVCLILVLASNITRATTEWSKWAQHADVAELLQAYADSQTPRDLAAAALVDFLQKQAHLARGEQPQQHHAAPPIIRSVCERINTLP